MEMLPIGTIIDIKNIPNNCLCAKHGLVIGADDIFTYYLPITNQRVEEFGRYYSITKSSISKNTIGEISGYIDFDKEYSTEYMPTIAGRFCNDMEINDIVKQYEVYQHIKEKKKPVLNI